jgi:DNA (cytosine-5)-methyltransferase 1
MRGAGVDVTSYYNEIDEKCCAVLQRHIDAGDLPKGFVDQRSIEEVQPEDLDGYDECHFFAGIGGFPSGFYRSGLDLPVGVRLWTGGFPCQDLSVAGQRAGLAGSRSSLWFEFHRLIASCRPEWVVIENVPGLLNSHEGRDFAVLLGGLTGIIPEVPADGWGNAGFARGPFYSVVYRILDAQYAGVAQRRRRVFIVASLGDGRAAQVLFERESSAWDPPPSREAGQSIARDVAPCLAASGRGTERAGESRGQDAVVVAPPIAGTLRSASDSPASHNKVNGTDRSTLVAIGLDSEQNADEEMIGAIRSHQSGGSELMVAYGGNNTSGPIDVATACNAHGSRRYDFESETFVASPLGAGKHGQRNDLDNDTYIAYGISNQPTPKVGFEVAPSLDAKEDGGGRMECVAFDTTQITSPGNYSHPKSGDPCHPLAEGAHPPAIAFQPRFARNGRGAPDTIAAPLTAEAGRTGKGDSAQCVAVSPPLRCEGHDASEDGRGRRAFSVDLWGVRRLTPTECERLQSFEDGWTSGQSDSARYRQLGNAVCVNVIEWIARRIHAVENGELS